MYKFHRSHFIKQYQTSFIVLLISLTPFFSNHCSLLWCISFRNHFKHALKNIYFTRAGIICQLSYLRSFWREIFSFWRENWNRRLHFLFQSHSASWQCHCCHPIPAAYIVDMWSVVQIYGWASVFPTSLNTPIPYY